MNTERSTKEAFVFLGLTLGLSWLVFWGPLALFKIPTISFVSGIKGPIWAIVLYLLGGFVPSLTAGILVWKKEGGAGLRAFLLRIVKFKLGLRWYGCIMLVVFFSTAGLMGINKLLGNTFNMRLFIIQLSSFLPLLILGPLSEELGWRGYTVERLQKRWNALISSMIIGVVWALWHLPLFFIPGTSQNVLQLPFISFLIKITAESVIYSWIFNKTHNNLWSAVFLHWIYTYAAQVVYSGVTRTPLYNWLECLPSVIMALIVVVVWKPWKVGGIQPGFSSLNETNEAQTA